MSPDEISWQDLRKTVDLQPDELGLICVHGIGDTYLTSALARHLAEQYRVAPVVISSTTHCQVASLFPQGVRRVVSIDQIDPGVIQQHNPQQQLTGGSIFLAHPWFTNQELVHRLGLDGHTLLSMHLEHFGLSEQATPDTPVISPRVQEAARRRFEQFNLPVGKTAILAPATSSSPQADFPWDVLAVELKRAGWCVCANSAKNDRPISGAIELDFPLEEAIPTLDLAGWLISMRSGFCDLVSSSSCRMSLLYPKDGGWAGQFLAGSSLQCMGLRESVLEYKVQEATDRASLVRNILSDQRLYPPSAQAAPKQSPNATIGQPTMPRYAMIQRTDNCGLFSYVTSTMDVMAEVLSQGNIPIVDQRRGMDMYREAPNENVWDRYFVQKYRVEETDPRLHPLALRCMST